MLKKFLCTLWLAAGLAQAAQAEAPALATYTVTFDATWSAATHPQSFPPNPHFSGLVGGTHDATVSFWSAGTLASTGIKQMAEWGSKPALEAEVQSAISAGSAAAVVSGGGIGLSPGEVAVSFDLTPAHPLISLTSMIAPSPDWFVGVHDQSLLDGDQWLTELVVPLYPYDAGTDSGVNYTSGDLPTLPPVPISTIVGAPFAGGVPLGTFTFRLVAAAAVNPPAARVALTAQPNPFNPATVLHLDLPLNAREVQLAVYDARGRLVRRLAPAPGGGRQSLRWDGRADDGQAVAAGVYFAQLQVDGVVRLQKMALIK